MIKYNTARRNEKNHIIISPEFNIYIFENHYILNEPKIASSYMDRHHKPARANFHNTNFSIIGYQESSGLLMNKGEKETMSRKDFDNWSVEGKDFDKDWTNLLEGNPTSKKFVFLIRNPIQKFISGIVQDYVIPWNEHELVEGICELYFKYPGEPVKGYPVWGFKNGLHREKYEEIVSKRLGMFFNHDDLWEVQSSDMQIFENGEQCGHGGYMGTGHIRHFQYWISDVVNFVDNKRERVYVDGVLVDNNNIDILDINMQSLHNTLFDWGYHREQDMNQRQVDHTGHIVHKQNAKDDLRSHVKPNILNMVTRYVISKNKRNWSDVVNNIQDTNLDSWLHLIARAYNNLETQSNPNMKSYEEFFGDWFISTDDKNFESVFDKDTHTSWCSKKDNNILDTRLENYNKNNPNYSFKEESGTHDSADHLEQDIWRK